MCWTASVPLMPFTIAQITAQGGDFACPTHAFVQVTGAALTAVLSSVPSPVLVMDSAKIGAYVRRGM